MRMFLHWAAFIELPSYSFPYLTLRGWIRSVILIVPPVGPYVMNYFARQKKYFLSHESFYVAINNKKV